MKTLVAVITFTLCIGLYQCLPNFSSKTIITRSVELANKTKFDKIKNLTYDTFSDDIEELCPGKSEKIQIAMEKMVKCMDDIDDNLTVCQVVTTEAKTCLKHFTVSLEECLPEESRGLIGLSLNSFISVVKFVCDSPGSTAIELLNPCFYQNILDESDETTNDGDKMLEEKFINEVSEYKKNFPTSENICGFATSLKDDIKDNLKTNCKNPKTNEAFMGLYHAIVEPCDKIR